MELALGTVQFGRAYGVAGRGTPVPEPEVRAILARGAKLGIRMLDTAAAYGDIESRLAGLVGDRAMSVVTKLPAMPGGISPAEAEVWTAASLRRAGERFGGLLHAVMFHRAEDLLAEVGAVVWSRCETWCRDRGIKLGVSCYDPDILNLVRDRFPVSIAQLPGNALDQRLKSLPVGISSEVEIHVRSAFLQGLLLLPESEAVRRLPRAEGAIRRWHDWLRLESLDALTASLRLVKGIACASHCVVGVNSLAQLEAVGEAWQAAIPMHNDRLAVSELDVIDPRRWTPSL